MPVIAMTEEMGSLAKDVSARLASELKLQVLRHEVVENVASRMHVSKSLINRLREGQAGAIERLRADRASMAVYTAEEVVEAAARGDIVLRGWGATCLLRDVPHVLRVRVTRPFPQRVAWLMNHLESDDAVSAEDEVRRSDQAHAARMHEQFGVTWGDPLLYDMVLNTERLSIETCVQLIAATTRRDEFAETDGSRALVQGMAVEARIRSALRENEDTQGVNVVVVCRDGKVTLSGIVVSDAERQRTEQVSAGVRGVRHVDNRLRVMRMPKIFPQARI